MTKKCAIPKSMFPVDFKVKSPVHALQLAKNLVKPFKQWTTGAFAVDKVDQHGNSGDDQINVKSEEAEAFCALGALLRVNTEHAKEAQIFLQQAAVLINDPKADEGNLQHAEEEDIFQVNDARRDAKTHRRVLRMFDKAIKLGQKAAKATK